ncbi:hypothetical protein L2E82_18194 [Cichorium intybus]|uniref:Uncharacterized protein n=1 Tax=Cichorium intybus TaxID=13427 RepID=A0ACB9FAU9_CICIN|nr:hypothetical protein L2E82_18194 [Cichorium intybus]
MAAVVSLIFSVKTLADLDQDGRDSDNQFWSRSFSPGRSQSFAGVIQLKVRTICSEVLENLSSKLKK